MQISVQYFEGFFFQKNDGQIPNAFFSTLETRPAQFGNPKPKEKFSRREFHTEPSDCALSMVPIRGVLAGAHSSLCMSWQGIRPSSMFFYVMLADEFSPLISLGTTTHKSHFTSASGMPINSEYLNCCKGRCCALCSLCWSCRSKRSKITAYFQYPRYWLLEEPEDIT